MDNTEYSEDSERAGNTFKNQWQAFLDKEITLKQLQSICFAWVIQNEKLYQEKPLPTEPIDTGNVSAIKFLDIKKAWKYYCNKIFAENKSSKSWLKDAREFFLNNDYEEGLALFNKYKNYKKEVELKEKPDNNDNDNNDNEDNNETRNLLIKQMEKATQKNVESCPF